MLIHNGLRGRVRLRHLNTCLTRIATQRPELRARFRGKPEHIVRLFDELSAEVRQLLAKLGPALDGSSSA